MMLKKRICLFGVLGLLVATLTACGGGGGGSSGGGGSVTTVTTTSYPGGSDIKKVESKLDAVGDPITKLTIYIIDLDPAAEPIGHGPNVESILRFNISDNPGAAEVVTHFAIKYTYSIPDFLRRPETAQDSLLSFSISPILQLSGTAQLIIDKNMYAVRAAGNKGGNPAYDNVLYSGSDPAIPGNPTQPEIVLDFMRLGGLGRLVIAAGLNDVGNDLHSSSIPCGIAADFCILAFYHVTRTSTTDGRSTVRNLYGTSFSTPIVTAAISEIGRVFGITIDKSIEVMFKVAREIPGCPADRCGQGALDLTELFDDEGNIIACMTAIIDCVGTSSFALQKGSLVLPGLDEKLEILAINEHVGVPFNLVTGTKSLALLIEAPDMDLQGHGNGFAVSSDSGAVCRQDVCVFASEQGLVGMRYSFAAINHCYAAYRRDNDFFSGYGTGSLAFGPSNYAHLGCVAKQALNNRLELEASVDLAYAKASDGVVVKDLRGVFARPAIGLNHNSKTTYGGNSKLSLQLSHDEFYGSFNANLRKRKLEASQTEIGLTWEYSF